MKHSLILASVAALIGTAVAGAQLAACSSSSSPAPGEDAGADSSESDSSQSPDVTTVKKDGGKEAGEQEDSGGGEDAGDAEVADSGLDAGDVEVAPTDGGKDAAEDAEITDGSHDAAGDTGVTDSGPTSSVDGGVTIHVYNYLNWCALTVNGVAITPGTKGVTDPGTTASVPPGTLISAAANGPNFEIGTPPVPFFSGTNAVTDSDAGVATTTLATGSTCVFACCPFSGIDGGPAGHDAGTGCDGVANNCTDAGTP
jgi:hypothetical protein